MNATTSRDGLSALNTLFLQSLAQYSRAATLWKNLHQWTWLANTTLTWFFLVLGIAALALPEYPWFGRTLMSLVPFFGTIGFCLTCFQLFAGPQQRWLGFRLAISHLWKLAMTFRARLPPFHDETRLTALASHVDGIRNPLEKKTPLRDVIGQAWRDFVLPPVPDGDFADLPKQGLEESLDHERNDYLGGRLLGQKQWYIRKARSNRAWYFGLLGTTAALQVFNSLWGLLHGAELWLMVLTTAVNLYFYSLLDFWDCGPTWRRYKTTALDLDEIEKAFLERRHPFNVSDPDRRLQRLVEQVEQALNNEFEKWFLIQGEGVGGLQSPPFLEMDYKPEPIPTDHIQLPEELSNLQEQLSRSTHDRWALQRLAEGWRHGPQRNDPRKEHPDLVPYERLPENVKDLDRVTAMETLKAILALGYQIKKG
jgi:hypothetical protein